MKLIKKWDTRIVENIEDLYIFNAKRVKRVHPITNKISNFTVLDSQDWANIIPITKDGNILMIEQYRHGSDSITYEIPGGLIEIGEEPAKAAVRELLEETGYSSEEEPVCIGTHLPNPAFLNNKCHTFVLENCILRDTQNLDENEIIEVHQFTKEQIKDMIHKGIINHGVILTAFYYYSLHSGF